jgi:hypothetical protein
MVDFALLVECGDRLGASALATAGIDQLERARFGSTARMVDCDHIAAEVRLGQETVGLEVVVELHRAACPALGRQTLETSRSI